MGEFLDTWIEDFGPPPPEGVPPNVRGIVFIVILILALVISTAFASMRIYTKTFITHALGWDDRKSCETRKNPSNG